jgi:hypothetical protein
MQRNLIFKQINRKYLISIIILCLIVFLTYFFRYKEVFSSNYKETKIQIALDRIKMRSWFCSTCNPTYGRTDKELYYVVFMEKRKFFVLGDLGQVRHVLVFLGIVHILKMIL